MHQEGGGVRSCIENPRRGRVSCRREGGERPGGCLRGSRGRGGGGGYFFFVGAEIPTKLGLSNDLPVTQKKHFS